MLLWNTSGASINTAARPLLRCQSICDQRISKALLCARTTHVAVEEPCARVICSPAENDVASWWDGDGVSSRGVGLVLHDGGVDGRVVRGHVERFGDDLEFVSIDQPHGRSMVGITKASIASIHTLFPDEGSADSPVEMERVEPRIPIIHNQLNHRPMRVRKRVRLRPIDIAPE